MVGATSNSGIAPEEDRSEQTASNAGQSPVFVEESLPACPVGTFCFSGGLCSEFLNGKVCRASCVWIGLLRRTPGVPAETIRVVIKNPEKPRSLPEQFFSVNPNDILNNPQIDVVVELIDDAEAAFSIVKSALQNGKAVVTANKKMVAERLHELLDLQRETGRPVLYEGACCASIPIIRNLEEYYDNDMLRSVEGIFNGSTNFILTRMVEQGRSLEDVLQEAQELGFAETDPTLDIGGFDPRYKLAIILFHAFGLLVDPDEILRFGIDRLNGFDLRFARSRGLAIKLLATCRKAGRRVEARVIPTLVSDQDQLAVTRDEYNAVVLEGAFSERQVLTGKGAGAHPTGAAVLSDISALRYDYRYGNRRWKTAAPDLALKEAEFIRVYVRYSGTVRPDPRDFLQVSEEFHSRRGHYLVGTISEEVLRKAAWSQDPEVAVLAYPSPERNQVKAVLKSRELVAV